MSRRGKSGPPSYSNLTVGSGTVVARYTKIGKTIIADFKFTLGAGSAIGTNPTVSLPVTPSTTYVGTLSPLGPAVILDNGASRLAGVTLLHSATTMGPWVYGAGGSYATVVNCTASVPMTWTSGDQLYMRAIYEAA